MTQSMVCGGCGAAVTYGRLACPECGELLATVAGVGRRSMSSVSAGAVAVASTTEIRDAPGVEASDVAVDEAVPLELPWTAATNGVDHLEHGLDGIMDDPVPAPIDDGASDIDDDAFDDDILAAAAASPLVTAPATALDGPSLPFVAPMTMAAATPGAYVPPVLQPAGTVAPARSWAGYDSTEAVGSSASGASAAAVAAVASSGPEVPPQAAASRAPLVDLAQATEFVGWLAIAGAMLAIVGFLLPWSSIAVIGASGVGYLDRWGFAGPWHVLVVLGLVGLLAGAILRDRVPPWLGIGLPGLGLGALLLGLVWPYLVGPLGGSLGAMAVALGALMLIGAGIATLVVDRHALGHRSV